MSELINKQNTGGDFRWHLLTTVSILSLCTTLCAIDAKADDADRPTVWVELGGQLERVDSKQEPLVPPFAQFQPRPSFEKVSTTSVQTPPRYATGGEAKLIIAPHGTDWSFQAGVRVGRSNSAKHVHQQSSSTFLSHVTKYGKPFYLNRTVFDDTQVTHNESHTVVDFTAGKDVGLGLGSHSTTRFDFGVRFAQFTSRSTATIHARPDHHKSRVAQPPPAPGQHKYKTYSQHHAFFATDSVSRGFSGVGPSISLNGSVPVRGNPEAVEIAVDWGANAAVLFGRQNASGKFKTQGQYFTNFKTVPKSSYVHGSPFSRSSRRVVPNAGGFAGLTVRHAATKVSLGYRADFFFGAMDGGIASRKSATAGFYGPFATISIGLGG